MQWQWLQSLYNWLIGPATDIAVNGNNADIPGGVVSGAINVPGLPGLGPAVGVALNPANAVPIANGVRTVTTPGSGITHQGQLNAIINEIDQEFAPPPPSPSPSPSPSSCP